MGDGALRETDVRPDAPRPAALDHARSAPNRGPVVPRTRAGATPPSLQFLQATAGNAAVARMLSRPAPPRPATAAHPAPAAPQAPTVARTPEAAGPEQTPTESDAESAVEPDQPAGSTLLIEAAAPPPPADPGDGNGGAPVVQRKVAGADFPGAGLILDAVRTIPGYQLMAQISGEDPITGDKVTTGRAEFVQSLLGFGPFAGAVGPVLQAVDALDSIFTLVQSRLGQHNLTLARIEHDIGAAWDEVHVANGIDANVAVVRRYVAAFLADVRAFASAVATDVIAAVRAAAVSFATPLVQSPTIKPVWDLGTKVFHYDPLKGQSVNAPTEEILADFLHLIGKDEALAQMRERGTLAQAAAWLNTQFATFAALQGQATTLFADAWAAISPENLPHLVENLHSLAQRAFSLLGQVGAFANTVLSKVVSLIKDALLGMLSERAHQTKGFTAMTVMLGKDPFTSAPVPRTPSNLIRAFITLLPNGDQVFEQLSQSGVIADAAGRIESEMVRLGISWEMISGTFHAMWDRLSLEDLLDPLGAFLRIINQFEEPLGRIVSFAATVLQVVIELILRLMNFPSELLGDIIAKAMAAIEDIKKDPIQFLTNIVQAMKQGVMGFLDKIGSYLLHGLTDWLFRGMRGMGIEPPKDLSLQSIITFVLQVLGVSEQTLWRKLEEKIGAPRVARLRASIDRMGQAWQFVKDVQERGIAAIWEFIQGQLTNLWDMILDKAKNWIMTEIIEKVTAKLLSMLDPTGIMAVVNSCIAFFNAIQSAIEYLREILQIVDKYVSTLASIARGDVAPGAKMLEDGLAQAVPVAIGFLANQVGLGNVPEKVAEILHGFQGVVDQALTWLIDQAWALGQSALGALGLGDKNKPAHPDDASDVRNVAGARAETALAGLEDEAAMEAALATIRADLAPQGLSGLAFSAPDAGGVSYLMASASPPKKVGKKTKDGPQKPKSVSCRLRVTLHFQDATSAAAFSDGRVFRREPLPAGRKGSEAPGEVGEQNVALVAPPPSALLPGRGRDAGGGRGLLMLEPGSGGTEVQLTSWNTGVPVPQTNDSHAERQFIDWFAGKKIAGLVKVSLTINLSPCSMCAASLSQLAGDFAHELSWDTVWFGVDRETKMPHANCTTEEDIALVRGVWNSGSGASANLSNAQKEHMRQSAYAHYERVTA